ncbi:cell adhesion molecule Dscam1-like isoform X1 [Tachypleus tridentatus]|uniref:cell adhesion molecule Dscam1-like isoform X1 n=1 Tax=Tachypleus tridentatus TaxID=6853 RepID=UPI003FD48428
MTPKIIDIMRRLVVKQGETAELPCAAEGYPVPSYIWYRHDGVKLKSLSSRERSFLVDGILRIRDIRVEDGGRYTCLVNNSLGSEKAETQLIVREPLSVEIYPRRQVIDIGKSASFNCSISGQPVSSIQWRKDLRPLEGETRRHLVSRTVVQISSVVRDDRGMYQCFVKNDWESLQSAGELNIGIDEPSLQEKFPEQTLQPGPPLSLRCVAQGSPLPQVTWSLDGMSLPESSRLRMGDYVTRQQRVISYVNISNVLPEDGGTYTCKATNDGGEVTHSAKINVFGQPFVRTMKNLSVVAGDMMTLQCPVGGYPIDLIVWEREGVRLPYNHRQKVYLNGTLVVRDIMRATDEGKYTCQAGDKEGNTAQTSLVVSVLERPVIDPFSFPASVYQGQRFTPICTVISGDSPVQFTWLKDGHMIEDYLNIQVLSVAEFSSTLIFKSLRPEHHGNYTCIARNSAGSDSHTATMVIHVPPRWRVEPSDTFVIKGETALIDCQADGFPHPRVTWTRSEGDRSGDFRPISSSSHLYVYENGTMAIHNAQKEDAGYYLCQATNDIAPSISKVIKLSIRVPAHFPSKFRAETVRRAHDAKLKCEARGDRPISIVWLKDQQPFHPQEISRYVITETVHSNGVTSLLVIHSADRRDSSLFTCIASNPYGSDETNIQLIMQEPPDTPQDLQIKLVTSRSVTIEWASPYSGNSPIIEYEVQWKEEKDRWQHSVSVNNISVHGSETMTIIKGLQPVTTYDIRVRAKNSLGFSGLSEPVRIKTDEESPGGPPVNVQAVPTSSHSVKVAWEPPRPEVRFGELKGYYIGYKKAGSADPYVYKTLSMDGETAVDETHVNNLRRFTKYNIVVQAFNSKGAGPYSDEVLVQTLPNDPPTSPTLRVLTSTNSSVEITWEDNTMDNNLVTGYLLYYKQDKAEWEEKTLSGQFKRYKLTSLKCGVRYQFYLLAFNSAGKGEPSNVISTKTEGMAPVAPNKESLLVHNRTSVTIRLDTWHDGGCPITFFSVSYKAQKDDNWSIVSDRVLSEQKQITIPFLTPGTRYQVKVTAHNEAGATEAEYFFVTQTVTMYTTSIPILIGEKTPIYLDLNIILPIGVSFVVVVVVMFLVCVIVRRRNSSESSISGSSVYNCRKRQTRENVQLSNLDNKNSIKKPSASPSRAKSFTYPQPYATTRLSESEDRKAGDVNDSLAKDEPLYATVKRTPRPPRSEVHVYDYEKVCYTVGYCFAPKRK